MDESIKEKTEYYQIYDVLKCFLAVLVVAIHTGLWPQYCYPWLRAAVPLFFIISAYLLFLRMKSVNEKDKQSILKNFISRNLRLYSFWFFALLPVTLYCRNYFRNGFLVGTVQLLRSFLFSSTFISSWFIMALIIGTVIVFSLSQWLSNKELILFGIAIFIVCTIRSSYWTIIPNDSLFSAFASKYERLFSEPFKSFPIAIFWIVIGKCFAETERPINIKPLYYILIFFTGGLLFAEWRVVKNLSGGGIQFDSYLMLAPFCSSLFALFQTYEDRRFKINTTVLRKISTIMYASHASIATIISGITNRFLRINSYEHPTCLTILTLLLTLVLSIELIVFSKNEKLRFLKASY